ncbi:MAG TPA: DUF547 domain-containing protein [Rhodospirillaceae bacterium]|nr:DUF547 domain-containing protein [Rhodospirillaceae bacterium]
MSSCGPSQERQEVLVHFSGHSENNTQTINHDVFNEILRTYVQPDRDGISRFAYGEIAPADRETLRTYIFNQMVLIPIAQYSRNEQLAYWINLYNALTLQLVLDHYPVRSLEDINISPGLFQKGPFYKKLLKVDDIALSLDDIRNGILLPVFKDARIHYALTLASLDSPNLLPRSFTAATADALLDQAAISFINHPRALHFEEDHLVANALFLWYRDDFGSGGEFINHLLRYANFDLAKYLIENPPVGQYHFDWTINAID